MRIFVAGGTGVVGRRTVARLLDAGHGVTGLARSNRSAEWLRGAGAEAARVGLFDPSRLRPALAGHEVVVNLATSIPPLSKAALPGAWKENDRIRSEGSRNLVDAALEAGVARYIQESIVLLYEDAGDAWITEESPVVTSTLVASLLDAEANVRRFVDAGGAGVVLRFGLFYAPEASHTRDQIAMAEKGVAATVGGGDAYLPSIHADDAAAAVAAVLEAPSGVYNVVDDEPLTRREHFDALAEAMERGRLRLPPWWLGKLPKVSTQARSLRVSNAKLRETTGWSPSYPSVREGWPAVVAAVTRRSRSMRSRSILLWALAASAAVVGAWAQLAPGSFYESFPGFGLAWVAPDGPMNEHLIRDVGGLNLGLAVLTAAAALMHDRRIERLVAVAWLVYAVPHLAYHATHLGPFGPRDAVLQVVSLSLTVALPVALLLPRPGRPGPEPASRSVPS